jgi:hypothetical protein
VRFPVGLLAPSKTADGEGGYTETYPDEKTIWIEGVEPGKELTMEVDGRASVNQNDVIRISSEVAI